MLTFLNNKQSKSFYKYRIASKGFLSDIYIKEINHLFWGKSNQKGNNANKYSADFSNPELVYQGQGIIGEYTENIRFIKGKNSYRLSIGNFLEFSIIYIKKNKLIYLSGHKSNRTNNLLIESLLGPVIIFCLSLDGIFCFHASAVEYQNQAILFLSKSGWGKSTLADYLDKNSDGKLSRIADDIIPITQKNDNFLSLPHFPQLKLTAKNQYPSSKPPQVKLKSIYILNKDNRRTSVDTHDFEPYQRILSLISNTVASRLFDKELNQQHLEFCNQISCQIPIKMISYPHKLDILPKVKNRILEDINSAN